MKIFSTISTACILIYGLNAICYVIANILKTITDIQINTIQGLKKVTRAPKCSHIDAISIE